MKRNPEKTSFADHLHKLPFSKFEKWWKKMNFDGDPKDYYKGKKSKDEAE